jgi:hypothetical protein
MNYDRDGRSALRKKGRLEKMRFGFQWARAFSGAGFGASASYVIVPPRLTRIKCEEKTSDVPGANLSAVQLDNKNAQSGNLATWCKTIGIAVDQRVDLFDTTHSGRGIRIANQKVKAGTCLISVPMRRIIHADNIEEDPDIGHAIGPLRAGGLDDRGVLALWILYQSLARDSKWAYYVSMLPKPHEMSRKHLLLSADSLEATPLGASVIAMKNNISRQIRAVMRAIRKLDPPAVILSLSPGDLEESWSWAHSVVMTRSGLLDHSEVTEWTQLPVSIIPVIDFCNHATSPSARVELNGGEVQLIANRDISPAEEVTISYWTEESPLHSEQSVFSFGFLSDADRFILTGIQFDGADSSPRKAIQRLLFLEKRSVQSDNIYLQDLPLAIEYLAVESMSEPQVIELAKSFAKEGVIGPETQRRISASLVAGKLKLAHILARWDSEVSKCNSSIPAVSEYLRRLKTAIATARRELDNSL